MTRSEVIRLIRGSQRRHYVYILGRPSGRPFYVGKGVAQRLFGHEIEARNPNILNYKVNINRSVWKTGLEIEYHIDEFFEHEPHALARERALIAQIGRHDLKAGPLANLLDGGEGASNPSEETKLRHADTLFGMDGVSERAIGNRFVRKLCPDLKSAPVKPLHALSKNCF